MFGDEIGDGSYECIAVFGQRIRVTLGLVGFHLGERRLRYQRPQTCVVGLFLEMCELFLGHVQLGSETFQPLGDVD